VVVTQLTMGEVCYNGYFHRCGGSQQLTLGQGVDTVPEISYLYISSQPGGCGVPARTLFTACC